MNLVDMKIPPGSDMMAQPEQPSPYPYGLRLCLNDDVLDKLGIEKLPELGAEITIQAKVVVVSRNESADAGDPDGDNDYKSMDLQITALGLGLPESDDKKAAKLYPKKE